MWISRIQLSVLLPKGCSAGRGVAVDRAVRESG